MWRARAPSIAILWRSGHKLPEMTGETADCKPIPHLSEPWVEAGVQPIRGRDEPSNGGPLFPHLGYISGTVITSRIILICRPFFLLKRRNLRDIWWPEAVRIIGYMSFKAWTRQSGIEEKLEEDFPLPTKQSVVVDRKFLLHFIQVWNKYQSSKY